MVKCYTDTHSIAALCCYWELLGAEKYLYTIEARKARPEK